MGSKFLVSVGEEYSGIYGGSIDRILSQSMSLKKECERKSSIPLRPSLTLGSQISLPGKRSHDSHVIQYYSLLNEVSCIMWHHVIAHVGRERKPRLEGDNGYICKPSAEAKWVILSKLGHLNLTHSLIEFFMGFQNIIKLLKLDKQNLNYRCLKLKPFR